MRTHYRLLTGLALLASYCAAQPAGKAIVDGKLRQALERVEYGLEPSGSGGTDYQGLNPAHRLALEFNEDGTRLSHPHGQVDLRLAGYGYGSRLQTPRKARPVVSGNRVEYRRGELREWFVNDARGLEQGFTLARRPGAARPHELLVIALQVAGDLRPELATKGDAVLLRSERGSVLRYAGLRAWDADGRALRSGLVVDGQEVRLIVDDRTARYPVVIDPVWTQQQELTAPDGAPGDAFGFSVSVDGNTAVVGAPFRNFNQGAVYVFVNSGTVWTLQQELIASGGAPGDEFGYAVAVSGDTIVVGAPGVNVNQGAAYVFVRSGSTWTQQQVLTASIDGAPGDQFGWSVSVDGDTAVVGAPFHTVGANAQQGAAYVFVRTSVTWNQQQELTATVDGAADDEFGTSVSVNGDTTIVGAPGVAGVGQGKAYVFFRTGTTWNQQAELLAPDGLPGDNFGYSVSVSGNTAVVGAPLKTHGTHTEQGAAYLFVRSGAVWTQQQKLVASNGKALDFFGVAVAVDGDTVLVGAALKTVHGMAAQGAVYVFVDGVQLQELLASDGSLGDQFGNFVSLSDGTALIGAYNKTVGANAGQGAAYIFVTAPDFYQVSYIANLKAGDSTVNLTNTGARGASPPNDGICANVYVFAPDQQMIACCACYVSPIDLQSLSAKKDLVSNTLTPGAPPAVSIALLASDPTSGTNCDPTSPSTANLEQGLRAWSTTIHSAPGGKYQTTEVAFQDAPVGVAELTKLTTYCQYIMADGSGAGICNSCQPGAMGAAKQ